MDEYLRDAVVLGAVYTLFALGLTLSWGVLNVLNLAHANVLVAAALGAYLLTRDSVISVWILLPICMVIGGVLSVAIELLVFRPIRRRADSEEASALPILIGSIAAGAVLFALSEDVTGQQVRSINRQVFEVSSFDLAGVPVTNIQVLIVVLSLTLSFALAYFVTRTRQGRALRALAYDRHTCAQLGISTERLAVATMFVAGALAGVAGLLLALYLGSVEARMGESLLLKAFAIIILGGVGSVYGAITGAYIIAVAEVFTVAYISSGLRDAVAFALILALLLLRPQGLFAKAAWQRA